MKDFDFPIINKEIIPEVEQKIKDMTGFEIYKAKEKGLKIVTITKFFHPAGKADKVCKTASPKDFLELILNADYIVTDSFHGTAFSLIFRKQFFAFLPPNYQDRIIDLLDELGLSDRILSHSEAQSEDIVYKEKEDLIEQYARRGSAFLDKLKEYGEE